MAGFAAVGETVAETFLVADFEEAGGTLRGAWAWEGGVWVWQEGKKSSDFRVGRGGIGIVIL